MLTIQQVRRIIQVGNYLRRNGKDDAADELFVALVAKLDAEPVSGVWLAYNYERPMLKPRTHSLMVRAGEDCFEMARSRLAAPIFLAHRWPEEIPPRQTPQAVADALERMDLPVPSGWLVPRDAPREAWMTADELEFEIRRYGR